MNKHTDNFDFPVPEHESEEEAVQKELEKYEKADRKYQEIREEGGDKNARA